MQMANISRKIFTFPSTFENIFSIYIKIIAWNLNILKMVGA